VLGRPHLFLNTSSDATLLRATLEAASQAYYYLLDDAKVPVERGEADEAWIRDTVLEVAEGILSQGFEPTPSFIACSMCDFRIACPAAER